MENRIMTRKSSFLSTAIVLLIVAPTVLNAETESATGREYRTKAAFLYNFIKLVEWPEQKLSDSNEPIVIGVIGKTFSLMYLMSSGKRK